MKDVKQNLTEEAEPTVRHGATYLSMWILGLLGLMTWWGFTYIDARGGQFNELASLLGLQQTQIPSLNNFFAPAQAGVSDAFALNQSSQQNSFNQRSASARAAKGEFNDLLQTIITLPTGGKGGG